VPLSTTTLTSLNASGARVLHKKSQLSPSADLLFRALSLVFFSPYASHASSPPWRSAAFAKRLLTSALQFPPSSALRSLDFVKQLLVREPKVEALLCSDDRTADGVYRADVDDPQVSNPFAGSFFELSLLESQHWDERVRTEAARLTRYTGQ
jgi:nucleolar complex protein 3